MSDRVMTLWQRLLASVNYETLIPKFPAPATRCIHELSEIAKEREDIRPARIGTEQRLVFEHGDPALLFFAALSYAALNEGTEREKYILTYVSLLDEALDGQRRCRVCGCSDFNGCACGCIWVDVDLCSACAEGGSDHE